jgi:hypothetical protein
VAGSATGSEPVTDLFNTPVLVVEQPSPQLAYRFVDPQGALLATADQVGGQKKSALQRFFSTGDRSRIVVQVSRPDGAPLFFVDRGEQQHAPSGVMQAPCALVAPDGTLIGHVEHNRQVALQSWGEAGGMGHQQAYRLLDAQGRPLCDVAWEPVRIVTRGSTADPHGVGGRFAIYYDMNRVQIARLDADASGIVSERSSLQLQYRLPDPLRVLVIASPIAIDLMSGS